ncbi:MAG: 30S ribosomal protein S4 [Candidatus Bostrichicola ureolyticus]|nr:MAG: 30S ribosomal protein S4 [Candidatus Bostrichicola ureolyticus]
MAKYLGPKGKIERRFGEPIFGTKILKRRKYQHGHVQSHRKKSKKSKKSKKRSEYAIQLFEKQKAKYTYGILERQFLNLFKKASKKKGITGELLLQMCESRLDNIVYRLNIARSRSEARQIVSHRHITVNNKIINIPSYLLKPGDIIGINKSKNHNVIKQHLNKIKLLIDWLTWNDEQMIGTFKTIPNRSQIPENIKENLIVELYSK